MSEGWLITWGEIAKHIGYSIRWTKEFHYRYSMPVLRHSGRVKADPAEIDAWMRRFNKNFIETAPRKPSNFTKTSRPK